ETCALRILARQLGERSRERGAVLLEDDEGVLVVACGELVEPVDGPVEVLAHVGPGELGGGPLVVVGEGQQLVARGAVDLGGAHAGSVSGPGMAARGYVCRDPQRNGR